MSGLHTVHVRVNEAATGQPTPVRIRFSQGLQYFAPLGRQSKVVTTAFEDDGGNVRLASKDYAYIDGSCEIALPPGQIRVEIHKGPEYRPVDQQFTLAPGKLALRFVIERWADARADGWYAGDTGVHFLTPHTALLAGAAEDLAVVNLLARQLTRVDEHGQRETAYSNITAFSGQQACLDRPGHQVVVNTRNCAARHGHLGLLNCHRIVFPLAFGELQYDWTMADWCDQCHRKGGLVVWNPGRPFAFPIQSDTVDTQLHDDLGEAEALADLILGKIDALEVDSLEIGSAEANNAWYGLQNCGFAIPLVGSAVRVDNSKVVGQVRTYARLEKGEAYTYRGWIEALRSGRTFISNGPLIALDVEGRQPGERVPVEGPDGTVQVRAMVRSPIKIPSIEIIFNGSVVAEGASSLGAGDQVLEAAVHVPSSGWLAARCSVGSQGAEGAQGSIIGAHTSPVYLDVAGRPLRCPPVAMQFLSELLMAWHSRVQHESRFENDQQRQRVAGIFKRAGQVLGERTGA